MQFKYIVNEDAKTRTLREGNVALTPCSNAAPSYSAP